MGTPANTNTVSPLENMLYEEAQSEAPEGAAPLENMLFTEAQSAEEAAPRKQEGLVEGVGKAVGRGFIAGGQAALMTEQNAANLLGKLVGKVTGKDIEVSQIFKNLSENLEQQKQEFYPEGTVSSSIPGKIIQGVASTPSMIGQVATLGGGITGFAALGAINRQEEGLGGMAAGAAEGATVGYIFKKAGGLKIVPRTAVGAGVGATQSAMAGSDSDQIIADAAMNGGFMATARPGVMKEILEIPSDVAKTYNIAAKAGKGFVDSTGKVIQAVKNAPAGFGEFITAIKNGRTAARELKTLEGDLRTIDQKVADQKDAIKYDAFELEDLGKKAGEQKAKFDEEQIALKRKSQEGVDALNLSAKTKKEIIDRQVSQEEADLKLEKLKVAANVENDRVNLEKQIETNQQDLVNTAEGLAKKIKNGSVQTFFENLSKGYEAASNKIFDFIDQNSPVSPAKAIDMLTQVASEINERGGKIEHSPVAVKIYEAINACKKYALPTGLPDGFNQLPPNLQEQYLKTQKVKGQAQPMPFKELRKMVKSITSSVEYGSYEADIMNHSFVEMTNDAIRATGNNDASLSFQGLQKTMSDAISYKTKIARTFGVKNGTANWENAAKQLLNLYTEPGATSEQRINNKSTIEAIKFLEGGNKLAPGIGDISSVVVDKAQRLAQLKEHYKKLGDVESGQVLQLAEKYNNKIKSLIDNKTLTDKTLERETESFIRDMDYEYAASEMKYDLAVKALDTARSGKEQVVRKGKEFIIEKGKEARSKREQMRMKEEVVAQRRKNLGLIRAVGYSMGAIGLWKFGRALSSVATISSQNSN